MIPPILDMVALQAGYDAPPVLHGIDLVIRPGEAVALMGRNGMGKTTTIRAIFGQITATHGSILVHGIDRVGEKPHHIAQAGLALVPEGRGIFPTLDVRENLCLGEKPGKWTLERVLDTFPRLAERLSHMGNQLSGGEQQMLAIGRALLTNPDLLVLDEATEGLAPLIRDEIWSTIETIKADGIATLVVDKDLKALSRVCETCVVLDKGHVAYSGQTQAFVQDTDLHTRLLGV